MSRCSDFEGGSGRGCALLYEAGNDPGAEANMAKMLAAEASWAAAEACLQTHGGFGFAAEYDVERKFRETRLYQVAPISTNLGFDFFVFPGQRHGYGSMSDYWFWLRAEYFVDHLLGNGRWSADITELQVESPKTR